MAPLIILSIYLGIIYQFWNRSYKRLLKQEGGIDFYRKEFKWALIIFGVFFLLCLASFPFVSYFFPDDKNAIAALLLPYGGIVLDICIIPIWSFIFYVRVRIRGNKLSKKKLQ